MRQQTGGEWLEQNGAAVLVAAEPTALKTLDKEFAARALRAAARIPDAIDFPSVTAGRNTLTISSEGVVAVDRQLPDPGRPSPALKPLYAWLRVFGSLDTPHPDPGVRVGLRELHQSLVLLGSHWARLQDASQSGSRTEQRAVTKALVDAIEHAIDPGGFFADLPCIIPKIEMSSDGDVVVKTRPRNLRGFLWLFLLDAATFQLAPTFGHCADPECENTFDFSGGGRRPRYCPDHRSSRSRQRALRAKNSKQAFRSVESTGLEAILEEGDLK